MISILIWIAVLGALGDIGRYFFRTYTFPKEPFKHCPRCGESLPEDLLKPCGKCGWERPKKPKPPVGAIILVLLCIGLSAFGAFMDSLPPSAVRPTLVPTVRAARATSTTRAQPPSCLPWQMVLPSMEGDRICAYGTIARVQEYYGATQLRFGGQDDFFFASGTIYYPDIGAGDCVYVWGPVLLSSEDVPYMNIDDALYSCEPWMR